MRALFIGIVLLSSVLVVTLSQYHEDDFDSDFDSDWFWIGSNLRSVGRPKLKISEHPDGYSMQIGYSGNYMRMRYTDSDNSVDFNFMDYKGSAKLRQGKWRPGGPEFEGTLEIFGGGERGRLPIDATIKIKNSRPETGSYPSRRDPYEIEISFVNKYNGRNYERLELPSARMRNPKNLEAVIKISVDPKQLTASTFSFNMNAEGETYRYNSGSNYDSSWVPAIYNLSASMMVISVVEPNPRQRQPKMTAALDLEEHLEFDDAANNTNTPRDQNLFKKSIVIEGMINLTGKGARLGVIKFTDADTDNSIGRIQARRADQENLRLEVFAEGQQFGALNIFQNAAGMTNITVEDVTDDNRKNNCFESKYNPSNVTSSSLNDTSYDTYGNLTESEDDPYPCKTINRLLESISENGKSESRLYNDISYIGVGNPEFRKRRRERGLMFEEKMSEKDGKYEGSVMISDGWDSNTMSCILHNDGENTNLQMAVSNKYKNYNNEIEARPSQKLDIKITPSTDEDDEFDFKLSYNNDRIFDGFFYMTRIIRRYAREHIPAMIDRQLAGFLDSHDETIRVLSEYI